MNDKTVLLIIDMQNDFIQKNSPLEVKGIKANLAKFKEFIDKIRRKGVPVIYTKHVFDPQTNPVEAKMFPEMVKDGLREGTKGCEINEELSPKEEDIVIRKRRYDAFIGTELEMLLKNMGAENIIITGTMTNVCCESTARTAAMKDFNVYFCSDLTFAREFDIQKNTLKTISSHFGKVASSKEILKFF